MSGFAPNPANFGRLRVAQAPHYCAICSSTNGVTRLATGSYMCARCVYDRARMDANNHLLRTAQWANEGPASA